MQSQVTSKTVGPMSMSDCPCCFVLVSFSENLVADVADESFAAVHIFSTLLSSTVLKQARQDARSRMHRADFMSNTPSNHCLQLQSTNHKLLTARNKTGQRRNCSSKSVSQIIRITTYMCFQVYRGRFHQTHLV